MNVGRRRTQTPRAIRCAMYVRVNVDADSANGFNSIRGQRRALRAFIARRKPRGWVCLPRTYEDIGHSGGTLKRPALRRLLADMRAGKVDCVVVHTFDRLTRSFSDQATLLAEFQRRGVALVTVSPVAFHLPGKKAKDALGVAAPACRKRRRPFDHAVRRRAK